VIGICANLVRARWGVWDQEAALLPFSYVDAVQRAGGQAIIIPPDAAVAEDPDQLLDRIDGLILAGGHDVDPAFYGAKPHAETDPPVPARDRMEIALAVRAAERDLPLLGICRGMQVLTVAFGGTLLQHLPDEVGHGDHRINPGSFDGSDHAVRLEADSLAARAAGEQLHNTKSHHHQGLDRVPEGISVTGHSTLDDLPEAIEMPGKRFVLGVQWHPEADGESNVVAALVEEARAYQSDRAASPGAV
jgi:putative glutamine amidotransferase